MTTSAGRTLGRYRLERLLGRGGMAEVWEARDQTLGRRVAVKIILPNLAAESRFHERFLSEARSVAALEHEHVLPIYDFGEAEGEPYLVMPFLDSGTLAERLKRSDPTPAQAIVWIRQLASALDAAHEAGVLHRDVKPANVMVGGGGRLLLADFGLAKSNQSADLTATGIALGTPAYMAPELARGEGATAASDRYALGVVAYELLCGRPPFVGDNPLALLHQHLTTPVPAVIAVRPDLPQDLDPAFARILAKDPDLRPASCAALADEIGKAFGERAFEDAASARPSTIGHRAPVSLGPDDATLATPVASGAATEATRSSAGAPAASTSDEPPTRRRGRTLAWVAVASALVVLGLCWMIFDDRAPRRAEQIAAVTSSEPAEASIADHQGPPPKLDAAPTALRPAASAPDLAGAQLNPQATPPPAPASSPATVRSEPVAPSAPPAPVAGPVSTPVPDDDASPNGPRSADSPGGAGRWAVPPAEALAIFGRVADAWRRGRFESQLFAEVENRSASLRTATSTPGIELLIRWIAGGKALLAGDREAARSVVAEFQALEHPPDWATLLPARFLVKHPGSPPDWQVALFWADPRHEARALVEAAVKAAPGDRNLQLARAVVDHLDGNHSDAARQAMAIEPLLRQGRARDVVIRFVADQLLWSGDTSTAISWYKRLLTTPDRTEIGAVLRTLSQEGGPELVARACADGFKPACDTGRALQGARGRRARPQP